jgi:hypothetical protein
MRAVPGELLELSIPRVSFIFQFGAMPSQSDLNVIDWAFQFPYDIHHNTISV